jgi:hypothetical protein
MAVTRAAIDEQIAAAVVANVAHGYGREYLGLADHPPQSSSASSFTAGACGFLVLTQCPDSPSHFEDYSLPRLGRKIAMLGGNGGGIMDATIASILTLLAVLPAAPQMPPTATEAFDLPIRCMNLGAQKLESVQTQPMSIVDGAMK